MWWDSEPFLCWMSLAFSLVPWDTVTCSLYPRAVPPFHMPSFNWKSSFWVWWPLFHPLRLIWNFTGGDKILLCYFIGNSIMILGCFWHLSYHPVNSWECWSLELMYCGHHGAWCRAGLQSMFTMRERGREEEGGREGGSLGRKGGKEGSFVQIH